MAIEMSQNLKVAEKLKELILEDPRTFDLTDWQLETYQNGREKGYSLVHYQSGKITAITFTEYRNTDDIVVYEGRVENHAISEEAWNNKRFFDSRDYEKASEFIINRMIKISETNEMY